MKISKNFVHHSLNSLLTAGIVFSISQLFVNSSISFSFAESRRIELDTATAYRREYVDFDPLEVTHYGPDGKDPKKREPLKGFVFNVSDLKEIIDSNRSGTKPNEVIFYFGQNGTKGIYGFRHGIIHIIAIGRKDGELLIKDQDQIRNEPSIFDKADPCPPFCKE